MDDDALNVQIGQRVQQIRQERGLSLRALEGLCGVPATQLSAMERGVRSWLPHHLSAVSRALSVHVRDFMPDEDRQPGPLAGDLSREMGAIRARAAGHAIDVRTFAASVHQQLNHLAAELDRLAGDVEGG